MTKTIIEQEQNQKIDYSALTKKYSWTSERNRKCILSPDSDGFLCGLAVSNLLGWEIVGFYDGKVLIVKEGTDYKNAVFLDIEINRPGVGSIGNHLVEFNRSLVLNNCHFDQCLQPNMLRKFDGKNAFQRKYPFGTIHLLLGILQEVGVIDKLPDTAISPLLFTDGVGNNLFGYPENCLDWIQYLKIDVKKHVLHKFLCENNINFYRTMQYLKQFFAMRDRYNAVGYFNGSAFVEGGNNKRTGHKIKISNGKGEPINLIKTSRNYSIHPIEAERVRGFIEEMAKMMGWKFEVEKWNWTNFDLTLLKKGMLSSDRANGSPNLNNQTYKALFDKNPFSLAMTASNRIEYTIENP